LLDELGADFNAGVLRDLSSEPPMGKFDRKAYDRHRKRRAKDAMPAG
jgi:hypothetical protein